MITESYVSFETAKLLKEAGFNCRVKRYFRKPGFSSEPKEMSLLNAMNINMEPGSYSCPTQELAARWLREVHGVVVDVTFCPPAQDKNWRYFIGKIEDMVWEGDYDSSNERYATYEEAMEDALRQALRRIIK